MARTKNQNPKNNTKMSVYLPARRTGIDGQLVYVIGNQIVGEGRTQMFAYYDRATGRYTDVNGLKEYDGSQANPNNFIPFPDLSEKNYLRVLALSAPGADAFTPTIPTTPAVELPFLRVAIFYRPRILLDARQTALVKPYRP